MSATLLAVIVLETVIAVLVPVGAHLALRRRAVRPTVIPRSDETTPAWYQRLEGNWPIFRRPAEFGPLRLPWDVLERIRVEILADQLSADEADDPVCVDLHGERVGLRGPSLAESRRELTLYWLAHWQDDVLALTGQGVAA